MFPPLGVSTKDCELSMPDNFFTELNESTAAGFSPSPTRRTVTLVEGEKRDQIRKLVSDARGKTLSKILNTQGILLSDLKLSVRDGLVYGTLFAAPVGRRD